MAAEHRIRRALLSVSDKRRIEGFAQALSELGVELISTGGTARALAAAGIPLTEVSALTGFPEIMDGRVKTLHPRVHAGLLARPGVDDAVLSEFGFEAIDLLVVNLYPFERTVADPGHRFSDAVEDIDIGGPAMLRAGAKNHAAVTVVADPADYDAVVAEMRRGAGGVGRRMRFDLAAKAFAHTARYDAAISNYLGSVIDPGHHPVERSPFPALRTHQFVRQDALRYGENPHQAAALYRDGETADPAGGTASASRLAQGKALSYNNIADADTALECVHALGARPACVIVKHANPCGAAIGETPLHAYEHAYRTDPTSAFGGIVAFNRALEPDLARAILDRQFVEVLIAPSITEPAGAVLATRPNLRVLTTGSRPEPPPEPGGGVRPLPEPGLEIRSVNGGLLVQEADRDELTADGLEVVTRRAPTASELDDLLFAWRVARFVKSNAIVYARDGATVGIGAGQSSRVYSARIARLKAEEEGLELRGTAMASDAFFPFRDGLDAAAAAGVAAVIQPGGSRRDDEVIAAADEHEMAMVFTGVRHFRH